MSTPWLCFATNRVWAHDPLERLFFWSRFWMTIQLQVAGRLMSMTRLAKAFAAKRKVGLITDFSVGRSWQASRQVLPSIRNLPRDVLDRILDLCIRGVELCEEESWTASFPYVFCVLARLFG